MNRRRGLYCLLTVAVLISCPPAPAQTSPSPVEITVGTHGKSISPDLFGIFFEDLSYAADGGLYAELVQNRFFEYTAADAKGWNSLTGWDLAVNERAIASIRVENTEPLNARNPDYAVLEVGKADGEVTLRNSGFDGMAIKAGEVYLLSLFARQLTGRPVPLLVRLEGKSGEVLASALLPAPTNMWQKYSASMTATKSDAEARLALVKTTPGKLGLDVVSLFPVHTFHGHPNGLRADLAESIAALKPKFIRFPGGCLVHGDGLPNMYKWKDTIGPIEQRAEQPNIWRYHQSLGLGYFEYFQLAEDIGATPVPIVAAGVSCQNSGASVTGKWGLGQQALPWPEMPSYVQDVLDLIEYANGPSSSTWGSKRAAAGHPEPFHLRYLGIGNEDAQSDAFRQRFKMIHDAVKAKHPEITIIGTVGPDPTGADYDAGWRFANQQHIEIVDEHSYRSADWFIENQDRYDNYKRNGTRAYIGEYAAWTNHISNLYCALAEAAYLTGLERNGDVVLMSSYAPLLSKIGHSSWEPDLIHFSNSEVFPSISYYVQQMFSTNSGDSYFDSLSSVPLRNEDLAFSAVRNSKSGNLILKLVNYGGRASHLRLKLPENYAKEASATMTLLTGDPMTVRNDGGSSILPVTSTVAVSPEFDYEAPAYSLTVFRLPPIALRPSSIISSP